MAQLPEGTSRSAPPRREAMTLKPDVVIRQVERLGTDLRELAPLLQTRSRELLCVREWRSVAHVYLVGCGDSFHASLAAQMAFESIGLVCCTPVTAQRFVDYSSSRIGRAPLNRDLMVAVSASGRTTRVIEAVERAKAQGALTVALTGAPSSHVALAADRSLVVELPRNERSPGVRTHQASFVGLLMLAIQLAEASDRCGGETANNLRKEIVALGDAVDRTNRDIEVRCRALADSVADCRWSAFLGGGPSYGAALFSAAKLMESAGVPAVGQDLEEWWHVERFAHPADMPLFVLAPPGRSRRRATLLADKAGKLGRRVVAVAHHNDLEITRDAWSVLPVQAETREEFSPLLYSLFASYLAAYTAERLGRTPFQDGGIPGRVPSS